MFNEIDCLPLEEREKILLKRSLKNWNLSIQEYSEVVEIRNKVRNLLNINS